MAYLVCLVNSVVVDDVTAALWKSLDRRLEPVSPQDFGANVGGAHLTRHTRPFHNSFEKFIMFAELCMK